MPRPKLILVDGYGFVFRAYHSLPALSRKDGAPIGAVYGFTNMLIKLYSSFHAEYIAVIFDSGKESFRNEIYPAYKANRPPAPEDLIPQFPLVRDVTDALSIKSVELPGYEADDLIAAYARYASSQNMEVVIVSSDKDLMQLINANISLYDPIKNKPISFAEVSEKFGVKPDQVADILALMGDSSDNVPGVPSIGPKTASDLINQFGNIENLLANIDKLPNNKKKEAIAANIEQARLSYRLVKIPDDVPMPVAFEELAAIKLDGKKLHEFLEEQGFHSIIAKHAGLLPSPSIDRGGEEPCVKLEEIKTLVELRVDDEKPLYIKLEEKKAIIGNQVINLEPKSQTDLFAEENTSTIVNLLLKLKPYLEDESILKICNNAKNLIKLCRLHNILLKSYDDKSVISYLTNNHGNIIEDRLATSYYRIERPLIETLVDMEIKGVKLDIAKLVKLSEEFAIHLARLEKEIHHIAGVEFNIGSPKQLGEILFKNMGIEGGKISKNGSYITDAEILEELAAKGYIIAEKVLEWRQFSKLKSTYTDALPKMVNPTTKRVHSNFSMISTSTGRLSSSEPNLQNIPIRSIEGHKIREAFIAEPGYKLISADYSQVELRILAHMADIPSLQSAFIAGEDIHNATACQIFEVAPDQVDSNMRRKAKAINFGIIYGISAFGLAKQLDVDRTTAKQYIEAYFRKYPGIQSYMEETKDFARKHGFVTTIFGKRCYIKGINDRNSGIRQFAERAAINAPIQGTAADIIKFAMNKLHNKLLHSKNKIILQIHDELLLEVLENEVNMMTSMVKKIMENIVMLSVPLIVDAKAGNNWAEIHV